jgi:hypothetical protein
MKIAIIDGFNRDIGLKMIFPEADYYIYEGENGGVNNNIINVKTNWSDINDKNYDHLFIINGLYDANPPNIIGFDPKRNEFIKKNYEILQKEVKIINDNIFKKVFLFDNYDYDYDPNDILKNDKIDVFFKRNYNKTKEYKSNVVPFPFVIFGKGYSIIEKIIQSNFEKNDKKTRIFFSGSIFDHNDIELNYRRNRVAIYNKIQQFIYNPGYLDYDNFIKNIHESKFGLDLNGVGDPNIRTFEILSQGALRIGEYNNLKWPFDDEFCEETIFTDDIDFKIKIEKLLNDPNLYDKCLTQQMSIYNKYFNKEWIRNYILQFMQ